MDARRDLARDETRRVRLDLTDGTHTFHIQTIFAGSVHDLTSGPEHYRCGNSAVKLTKRHWSHALQDAESFWSVAAGSTRYMKVRNVSYQTSMKKPVAGKWCPEINFKISQSQRYGLRCTKRKRGGDSDAQLEYQSQVRPKVRSRKHRGKEDSTCTCGVNGFRRAVRPKSWQRFLKQWLSESDSQLASRLEQDGQ